MTEPTLVKVTLFNPEQSGDAGEPFTGRAMFKPTLVRHIEGETPPDYVVTDRAFYVTFGEALMDGLTIVQPATPGVAWAYLEPTDDGPYANLWAWEIGFYPPGVQTPCGGSVASYLVPTVAEGTVVDFGDLTKVDPDDPPILPPEWQQQIVAIQGDIADLEAEDQNLQDQIDNIVASGVLTVNGEVGTVTVSLIPDPDNPGFMTLETVGT